MTFLNPFKRFLKNYHNYQKKDRIGILVLCSMILAVIIVNIMLNYIPLNSGSDSSNFQKLLDEWEIKKQQTANKKSLFVFNPNRISEGALDSLDIPAFVKQNILNYRKSGGSFKKTVDLMKIYGMNDSLYAKVEHFIVIPNKDSKNNRWMENKVRAKKVFFDPNSVTEEKLTELGFNNFQKRNLIQFRKKGGAFNSKTDLLKIYGIDSIFYKEIEKYIRINIPDSPLKSNNREVTYTINLNRADSSELVMLKGIGPVYASRIIKYRDLLGGFYSKAQLLEVYNFPEETYCNIESSIDIDTSLIEQIRINFADYTELIRHPYLNRKCVKSLIDYRNKNGAFVSKNLIYKYELVDSLTFSRIMPYLSCR